MRSIQAITLTAEILAASLAAPAYAENNLKQHAAESKAVVKEFVGQLQGELKASMKAGGPITAIGMCKEKAPLIAKELSEKYNWTVARTSLKTRNPANTPDAWEEKVLKEFEVRKQSGEAVKPMAYFDKVEVNGVESFRFMKAIPVGKPCLACHGENISDDVAKMLSTSYPQDKATGYKLGDVRGAFTITKPMN